MTDEQNTNPSDSISGGPPFRNWKRDLAFFLSSQTISLFGSMLVQYAMAWYITLETQSGAMLTVAVLCGFLPTFIISPFAGVWADRYNRKNIIVAADSFIALSTLILAVLFLTGYKEIWLLFVVMALRALGTGIHTPAVGAILPQIVPFDSLTRVNGFNTSIMSAVAILSPMLSGALLILTSIETIFFIDVATAAIAVSILLLALDVPSHARALARQTTSYFADIVAGIRYIRSHRFLTTFFLFSLVFFFLISPIAFLSPLQVVRNFGGDVWRLTAVEVGFSAGMLLGGILMAFWGGFKNKARSMALSSILMGAFTLALGITPVFWLYLIFMGILGVSMPIYNTPLAVLLQQKVETDFLGRIFGVLSMISSMMLPLGMLVFGPLADFVNIDWLLVGTGFLIFIEGLLMMGNKTLLEAGK
jgi:DHA3 family macrolide efflux protein-like MFS transporter